MTDQSIDPYLYTPIGDIVTEEDRQELHLKCIHCSHLPVTRHLEWVEGPLSHAIANATRVAW
jgi:hypothetical protein